MDELHFLDLAKLKADMAAHVETTTARKFSLAATGGDNPDFYRNLTNNGRDKRLTADVFIGVVKALGRDPWDYIKDGSRPLGLPSGPALTTTFAVLLDSLGIDPYEDERAQKLAAQFPNALRHAVDLHARIASGEGPAPGVTTPADDEDQPEA